MIDMQWQPIIFIDKDMASAIERLKRERKVSPYLQKVLREALRRDGYLPKEKATA